MSFITHEYRDTFSRDAVRRVSAKQIEQAVPVPMPAESALLSPESGLATKRTRNRDSKSKATAASQEISGAPEKRRSAVMKHPGGRPVLSRDGTHVTSRFEPRITELVEDVDQYPYSAVGKMFFKDPTTGADFVGTGWVIGRRAIATAAHCLVNDNGDFFTSAFFYPGYIGPRRDDDPEYRLTMARIPQGYVQNPFPENLPWDLGVAILERDISYTTGWLGYDASGDVVDGEYEGIGYPGNDRPLQDRTVDNFGNTIFLGDPNSRQPFNFRGNKMWRSLGEFTGIERLESGDRLGFENEMTGGSSGGPIIESGTTVAHGLISTRQVPHDNRMFSPVLDEDFVSMVQWLVDNDAFFDNRG